MNTDLPRSFKLITLWLLLGAVVFVGVQWLLHRAQQAQFQLSGGAVEIHRGRDGHYHWPGRINGHAVDFLIDTGATGTAIPESLARKLKLRSIGTVRSNTAGGVVTGQLVRADLELMGGVNVQRLSVLALPGLGPNPLLGMDVLGTLRWQQSDSVFRIEANAPP
ncbi:MAG: clan AA aspartic protease [Burkholderiales bacterium]|nr:clan AA aspartic protease [Burkholderiales bacterium]MDE2299562.1 clan AA aspartic protease [Burkholderiales bacterium]